MSVYICRECKVICDTTCHKCGREMTPGESLAWSPATPRDLEADMLLCDAATPGPWTCEHPYNKKRWPSPNPSVVKAQDGVSTAHCYGDNFADGDFIAAARTGWPETIRELRKARARIKQLQRTCREMVCCSSSDDDRRQATCILGKALGISQEDLCRRDLLSLCYEASACISELRCELTRGFLSSGWEHVVIKALQRHVPDLVLKPNEPELVQTVVAVSLRIVKLQKENEQLRARLEETTR